MGNRETHTRRFNKFTVLSTVLLSMVFGGVAQATIISNGSFETPDIPDNDFLYNPSGGTWSFLDSSGIIDPVSGFTAPPAPDGAQIAFLQAASGTFEGSFSQSISLTLAGGYNLSYQEAGRPLTGFGGDLNYQVLLDSTIIADRTTTSGQPFIPVTVGFSAAAGIHTLTFRAPVASGDNTAFFDAVAITSVPEASTLILWGIGVVGILGIGWRQRKKVA